MQNESDITKDKSSISNSDSYQGIGDYWDAHDAGEIWEQTESADFDVNIEAEHIHYVLDSSLSARVRSVAKRRGISSRALLQAWIQEKLQDESA